MFYSCDSSFFRALIFEAEERPLWDLSQDIGMWCNFITHIRVGPYMYPLPLHFEGWKSADFAAQLGDDATLNSCNLKIHCKCKN